MDSEYKISSLKSENEDLKKELELYRQKDKEKKSKKFWLVKILKGYAAYFFLGKDLKASIQKLFDELTEEGNKVSKKTIRDVIANVAVRLVRISLLGIIIAFIPLLILFFQTGLLYKQNDKIDKQNGLITQQNNLISKQNGLIEFQNKRLEQQTNLQEAERRSSLVFLFSNIMDAVDRELKEDYNNNELRDLSPQLIGRIISLSARLKPYRYLENDILIKEPISPERGQLLLSLIESELDSLTYLKIFRKANFEYSDLKQAILNDAFLSEIKLNNANLYKAKLNNAKLRDVMLKNSNLSGASFDKTNLRGAVLDNSNLSNSFLNKADLEGTSLRNSNLECVLGIKANFTNSNLSNSSLKKAILRGTIFVGADLTKADLTKANLDDSDLRNINLSDAQLLEVKMGRTIVSEVDFYDKLREWDVEGISTLRNQYIADSTSFYYLWDDLMVFPMYFIYEKSDTTFISNLSKK